MDTIDLVFNDEGERVLKTEWTNNSGTTVDIYNCHLKIKNKKLWVTGCEHISPTIGSVNEGDVNIFGFNILAKSYEVPQQSIFFHIAYKNLENEDKWVCGISSEKGMSEVVKALIHLKKNVNPAHWYVGREYNDDLKKYVDVIHNVSTHEVFNLPENLLDNNGPDFCPETLFAFERFLIQAVENRCVHGNLEKV